MGIGLLNVVSRGEQDCYLTGNPQITFFKKVFKRHTNFSIENIRLFSNGTCGVGNTLSFKIDKNADLIGKIYLKFYIRLYDKNNTSILFENINKYSNISKSFGYSLIETIEFLVGGSSIDKHTGEWLAIQSEINDSFNQRINNLQMNQLFEKVDSDIFCIHIPLQFFFNKHPGNFLPILSLKYHDLFIQLKLSPLNKLITNNINNTNFEVSKVEIVETNYFVIIFI